MMLSDDELQSLNRAILLRYGIDFTNYETTSLKRRISRAMDKNQCQSSFDLWRKMLKEPDYIYTYINEITVGLTEMFRNPDLWIKMKNDLLSHFKDQEQIKIWHAGCSTGEEVYTMAILLKEAGLIGRTKAYATDINSNFLQQAEKGIYDLDYLKRYEKNYRIYNSFGLFHNYYTILDDEQAQMNEDLKMHVTFLNHNLTKDLSPGQFDLIFCRNVMIYFDETLKKKILKKFYDALLPQGYFIIGYFDSLPAQDNGFFRLFEASTKIFAKSIS